MKVTIEVELQPFQTPDFVSAVWKRGFTLESFRYQLSDICPETLDKLCNDFRAEVFRKAGKEPPPECCGAVERSTQPLG